MRTAMRRARRLGAFLLVAVAAGWVFLRRRSPVRWIEAAPAPEPVSLRSVPPAEPDLAAEPGLAAEPVSAAEPGGPGELDGDVLATDAGLTALPEPEPAPEETRVAELLADAPSGTVVDEPAYEQALADAAPAPDAPAVPGDDALLDTEAPADPAAPEPIAAGSDDPAAAQAAIAEPGV
ncbi:MAG TPA: hypothetical protein VLM05_16915, partial [Mycobacteriales bacterium]|nr:hypothetical protein [Mycobacteriales bacterium]